jgi:putative MATE family efflux protein
MLTFINPIHKHNAHRIICSIVIENKMSNQPICSLKQPSFTTTPTFTNDEPISKVFWRFAIPSVAAMMVNGLYQITDGIFVGHYVGFEGLAGINMTMPIIGVIIGLGIMVGMGGGSLLSISRGEGNIKNSRCILTNSLWLVAILSVLSSIMIHFLAPIILNLQGAKGVSLSFSLDYINVFTWGSGLTILAVVIPMLIRNDNSPNFATALMILGAVTNILFDYLLMGVYSLGLQGVAIATVAAQSIVIVIGLYYFFSSRSETKLSLTNISLDLKTTNKILILGSSSLFMFIYFSLVIALHNKLFMEYGSSVSVGAFAIVGYIATLYYVSAEGIANGMQPPVSFYFGSQQADKIKATLILALKIIFISGLTITLILNLYPNIFITLFNKYDPILLTEARIGLQIHLSTLCLDGFLFIASVYFMSVNQGAKALAISIANIIAQLPFLYFLPKWFGINGIWLALPLSNIVLALIVAPLLWNDVQRSSNNNSE